MLEFARDLNESNIKKKITEKEYDLNTYGKMSSEMKRYLVEDISCLED
jgi:predicted transcriptional regulator with HTH domain